MFVKTNVIYVYEPIDIGNPIMRLLFAFILGGILFTISASAQKCVKIGYWAEESDRVQDVMRLIEKAYQKAGVCYQMRITSRARALREIYEGRIGAMGWAQVDYVSKTEYLIGFETPIGYTTFDMIFDQMVVGEIFDPRSFDGQHIGIFQGDHMARVEVEKLNAKLIEARYWEQLIKLLENGRVASIIVPSVGRKLENLDARLGSGYGIKVYNGTTYLHVMHKRYAAEFEKVNKAFTELYGDRGFFKALEDVGQIHDGS